jgi:hypothetical protein
MWHGYVGKTMGYVVWVWIQQSPLLLLIDRLIHFKTFIIILKVKKVVIGILKLGRAKKRDLDFCCLATLLIQFRRFIIFDIISTLLLLSLLLQDFFPIVGTHRLCKIFRSVIIRNEWRIIFISLTVRCLIHLIGLHKSSESPLFICNDRAYINLRLITLNFFICGRDSICLRWHYLRNSTLINN